MKIRWLLRSKKLSSLAGMLGMAACVVIGGRLYQWRQDLALRQTEAENVQTQPKVQTEIAGTDMQDLVPQLDDSQIELLNQIEDAIRNEQLDKASKLMLDHGDEISLLYYDVLGGEPYLYSEGQLSSELQGNGMVFRKPSTVFYGKFVQGKPEGQAIALQVIQIDHPRYDYSAGAWLNGRMNGKGSVGYCYYKGAGEENRAVSRTGIFIRDKLNGAVLYSTTNSEGDVATWDMTAENGALVLDESWVFDEEKQAYQLVANEYDGHAFVASEEAAKNMMFQNMIPWE